MYNPRNRQPAHWLRHKDTGRNLCTAFFHMLTISLTCTSLAQLGWFRIHGGQCVPHLAIYQFFTYGYFNTETSENIKMQFPDPDIDAVEYNESLQCITPQVTFLMRVIILLCFMTIISALFGFFIDIIGPSGKMYRIARRNAVPSILCVLWITFIIAICYYISILLSNSLANKFPGLVMQVSFEYGFCAIVLTGILCIIGAAVTILTAPAPSNDAQEERLIDDWDSLDAFDPTIDLPPPPPYTP